MVMLKAVNRELKRLGYQEELVQGEGYFFFMGGEAHTWPQSGVYVYRLNQLTLEQWINQRNLLAKQSRTLLYIPD